MVRRPKRPRVSETLNWMQRCTLLDGVPPMGNPFGDPHTSWENEHARAAWEAHRDELLDFWLQDPLVWAATHDSSRERPQPGGPGTRPWAWWKWDAPEPRRNVAGEGEYPRYEPQRAYLERLGLLTDEERAALEERPNPEAEKGYIDPRAELPPGEDPEAWSGEWWGCEW